MGNHTSMRSRGRTSRYVYPSGDTLTRFPPMTQRVANGILQEGQRLWASTVQTKNEWAATIDRVDGSVLIAKEGEETRAPNLPVHLEAGAHHLHTHPTGDGHAAPINTTDVQIGIDNRYLSMTVFSHSYVYHIRPGANGWGMSGDAFKAAVRPRWNSYNEAGFLARNGAELWSGRQQSAAAYDRLTEARESAAHDAWERVAQELGWTYSRSPRSSPSIPLG